LPTVPDSAFRTCSSTRNDVAARSIPAAQSGEKSASFGASLLSRFAAIRKSFCGILLVIFVAGSGIGAPAAAFADPAEDIYLLAAGYYKKERFDLAAEQFQNFVKSFPGNSRVPTARFFLGLSQINNADYKNARESLRLFLVEAPTSVNAAHAAYRIAECSYLLDDLAKAEPELTGFLTKYPEDSLADRALPYLGDVELRLNKIDKALQTFQAALKKFPAGPMAEDCEFGLAKCHEAKKDLPAAIVIYTRLAANVQSERAAEAQLNLGNRLYDLDKYADAAVAFDKLEVTFPTSTLVPISHLNHGFSLFEIDQFAKASEQFALAEKEPTQTIEAAFWRSQCFKSLANHQTAVQILKPLVAAAKEHKLAEKILYHLADSHLQLGQFAEAQALSLELRTRFPKGELADEALLLSCRAAIESGNVAESEQLLDQFGKVFPQSPLVSQADLLRGRLQLMKMQTAAAIPIFEKVIKESPNETSKNSARYYIGYAQLELGHPEAAMLATEPLALAVEKDPAAAQFSGVHLLRAAGQLALGNKEPIVNTQKELYAAAMASASMFLQKSPTAKEVDQALAIRALAASHAGLKDRAKADVDALSKNYPNSPEYGKTLYEVAEVAYANSDWEWSQELFSKLALLGKTSKFYVPGVSGQAWSLQQQKQFPAAGKLFAQLAAESPDHKDAPEWAFMYGKTLQASAKPAEAVPAFDAVLKRYPTAKFAYLAGLEAARLLRDSMQYAEADVAYSTVLEKFPKPDHLDKILNEWALSNYEGKNYPRSDEVFSRLVRDTPDSDLADNARLSLAESDLVSGKIDVARPKFQALTKDPKADALVQQTALFQLIGIAIEQRNWDEVKLTAEALTSRFPSSKYFWYAEMHQAEADLNKMETGKAIERLQRVIAQKDQPGSTVSKEAWFGQAWVLLAEAYYREKKHDAVAKTAADCRAWNPDLPSLYILDEIAGRSQKAQAKFPEALATFQRIVDDRFGRRTETAAKAQFMMGEIYLLQKNYAKAESEFLKVDILYKFPEWQAPALFQAGSCQEELMHWKDAGRSYDALIKGHPKSEYAKMAAERLPRVKQKIAGK
jgi:TolA-binding protein